MQALVGLFGLFVRHRLALLVFKEDNWGEDSWAMTREDQSVIGPYLSHEGASRGDNGRLIGTPRIGVRTRGTVIVLRRG
ncbi:hypothetical protein VTK73DRAFT_6083 [Phialemonium thermophilum]|uniref:Uncharacterized protein n=1 Tax=Phialemonium thermophilum TaxID=223376 RepID=A0ABR3V1P7_9PEZI